MYEKLPDELAPPNYDIPVLTNADTQVYDLPIVTTDISVNTNPAMLQQGLERLSNQKILIHICKCC